MHACSGCGWASTCLLLLSSVFCWVSVFVLCLFMFLSPFFVSSPRFETHLQQCGNRIRGRCEARSHPHQSSCGGNRVRMMMMMMCVCMCLWRSHGHCVYVSLLLSLFRSLSLTHTHSLSSLTHHYISFTHTHTHTHIHSLTHSHTHSLYACISQTGSCGCCLPEPRGGHVASTLSRSGA
jgi:hypothetical protein